MDIENPRVLHVIARFNLGGTAKYLTQLIPELEAKSLNTLLAVGRIQAGEVEDSDLSKLNYRRIEKLGRRISPVDDAIAYFELRKVVKSFRPHLIHTHTFKAGLLCRLMFFNTPKIHTFHGHLLTDPEFSRLHRRIIIIIEKSLARITQRFVVTGHNVAVDLLANKVGKPGDYVSIPGNVSHFTMDSRNVARERFNLGEEFTIIWLARVAPVKNAKLLVKVAKLIPDCVFLMAGDGVELDEIRILAPANIKILGYVPASQILSAGDVFLSTSLNEGIPYSILEAKLAGLPIVAVNVGSIQEVVNQGVDGFLVEANAEEIKDRILQIRDSLNSGESAFTRLNLPLTEISADSEMAMKHVELYNSVWISS